MTESGSGSGSGPGLAHSASFTSYSSGTMADIAARVVSEFALDDDDEEYYNDVVLYRDDAFTDQHEHRQNDVGLVDENEQKEEEEEEEADSDFEFAFAVPSGEENSSPISADEIFSNGQIKPLFPVFNTDLVFGSADWRSDFQYDDQTDPKPVGNSESSNSSEMNSIRLPLKKLLLSERDTSLTASASCSSSEADDLEGANPATYCVWRPPKEEMSKKSKSTGSSKRWRLRNLVHRSHSDGRDNFVFMPLKPQEEHHKEISSAPQKPVERSVSGGERRKEEKAPSTAPATAAVGNAHRQHYLKNRATRESDRKKSYLPYRQDLVGFFANVNGLSRTIQPF